MRTTSAARVGKKVGGTVGKAISPHRYTQHGTYGSSYSGTQKAVAGAAIVGAAAYGGHKLYKAHQIKTQNANHGHAFHVARAHSGA